MLDLTTVLPTSKSPLSEEARLTAEVVRSPLVARSDLRQMYGLLETYFENTSFRQFEQDLSEKDYVILLRSPEAKRVAGFTALMRIPTMVKDRPVIGFFSGDTIIAREYWGSSLLARLWVKPVFAEAARIHLESPDARFYWFLICSGYKTWRFLPVFFREYLPHPEARASEFDREVLPALATGKFGERYNRETGVIRFDRANPLRPGIADVPGQRLQDPRVEFFVTRNPGYAEGDELACLAPISHSNLTPAGLRMLRAGVGR